MTEIIKLVHNYIESLIALYEAGTIVQSIISSKAIEKALGKEVRDTDSSMIKSELEKCLESPSKEQLKIFSRLSKGIKILPRSYIISSISIYDYFLSNIFEKVIFKKEGLSDSINKQIPLSEMKKFSSIKDIELFLIQQEIDGILRESHIAHLEWIEKKLSISLVLNNEYLASFVEITERRNLFVHADGIVNSQYLNICKKHQVDIKGIKNGEILNCDDLYLKKSISDLITFGFLLLQTTHRKVFPNKISEANSLVINIIFNLISDGFYKSCIDISKYFISKHQKSFSEEEIYILKINLAQAYKWDKQDDKMHEILNTQNWELLEHRYYIAYLTLTNNWEELKKILKTLQPTEKLNSISFKEWPLFKELREQPFFNAWFEKFNKKKTPKSKRKKS